MYMYKIIYFIISLTIILGTINNMNHEYYNYNDNGRIIIPNQETINNLPSDSVIVKILFTENEDQRKIMLYSTGSKSKKFINKIK